jgi:Spy/CpxP family protein refolding chaperone
LFVLLSLLAGACAPAAQPAQAAQAPAGQSQPASTAALEPTLAPSLPQTTPAAVTLTPATEKQKKQPGEKKPTGPGSFTMEQTLSDKAQEMTIAFDGLAFLTGNLGSDSFFPPGKVADFWGFQYLRDNDPSEMGHNTDFLTLASLNMFSILTSQQKTQLADLARSQVASINDYGYKRFVLMTAFRRLLGGDLPAGTSGLNEEAVRAFSAEMYRLDGQISLERAQVMGNILYNLNDEQKAYLAKMVGQGMTSWPVVDEPVELRPLSRDEKIAVMTYSGDLFSWYAGSIEADVYFCPERHGTYFGSFYMKDAPAVGNPGYSIGTNITADMGDAFIAALSPEQAPLITGLVDIQRPYLEGIVDVRTQVSTELRQTISGGSVDSAKVLSLMEQYGQLDGSLVYNFATNFAKVGQTLTEAQKATLMDLRHQTLGDYTPDAAYLFSEPIPFPDVPNTDFLFK